MLRGIRKTGIEFIMMCTVHNIKKRADIIKREGKKLKDRLKMIVGWGGKAWNKGGIRERIANTLC